MPSNGARFFPAAFAAFAPRVDATFAAYAYDCAVVVALAAEAARSDDPAKFVRQLGAVTRGGTKCSTFAACKKLLDRHEDIDYEGASGPLDLTSGGEPAAGAFDVYQFQADGSYTVVKQLQ